MREKLYAGVDLAPGEPQPPRHRPGQRLVVGDDHGGDAQIAVHLAQELVDALAGGRVEVAGGLVGQQQRGLEHQRARQRHPLRLAARELARAVVHARAQPHPLQQLARASHRGRARPCRWISAGMATFSSAVNSGSR